MTVAELKTALNLEKAAMPHPDKAVTGVYIGDLLSRVMTKASKGDAWITIMSNVNVIAVAALSNVSTVILAEGVSLDKELIKLAEEKGINVLLSEEPSYRTALKLSLLKI